MANSPPLLNFEQMLANLKRRSDWQQLPDIRVAMWPGQVSFSDDLSDKHLFNDRYLESRVSVGKMAFVLYLVCGAFLATFIPVGISIISAAVRGKSAIEIISDDWIIALFSVLMFCLGYALSRITPSCVRFNRQAQVVHIYGGPNKATTAPWRDVYPFTEFSASADGKFSLNLVFRTGPTDLAMASGAFDIGDESALVDNLTRLEFLRRYMAEGLSAVQPDPQRTLHKPSGFTKAVNFKDDGLIDFLLARLVVMPGYYLAGGPLIDRYLIRRAASAQWPDEVERLCAPGADLSGYDTTPVEARKDIYHRFNGHGFDLVNLRGEVVG
ncbi:hypothetical protein [Achromobacter sp. MFA1 R4]|uniref:DUF6708 domain-containing protein n=1 Tax=Achromobacter sp. MFA1 R4 TaxID=1881016 RepID=UPI0009538671|nr:hypothetical protein [Achromobacter sp. MFA1 R4]SIT06265.1 hypothetical protein SAMN05428937_0538 [Achromobacter sp. MFA1 R4]